METDFEINRLCAEHIMGYWSGDNGSTWTPRDYRITHNITFDPINSDRDAMMVYRKVAQEYTVSIDNKFTQDGRWYVQIGSSVVLDENLNHAIVLAALKAKGINVE